MPFFSRFPGSFQARRKRGRGQGGAPCWTNDLEAGPGFGDTAVAGNGVVVGARPRGSLGVVAGARLRSSLRGSRAGPARVHGALRGRAAGSIRGTAGPPGAGARPAGDHALSVSGAAHAASLPVVAALTAVRAARDLACPSRRA